MLDTLVHGAAVDLFRAFGIAAAPMVLPGPARAGVEQLSGTEVLASIGFVGRGFTGTLLLAVPEAAFELIQQAPGRQFGVRDWTREAANQLLGRIKSRVRPYQVHITCGLPSTPNRNFIEQLKLRSKTLLVYAFRTIRGGIFVVLAGDLDCSLFVYSGGLAALPSEGDVILF